MKFAPSILLTRATPHPHRRWLWSAISIAAQMVVILGAMPAWANRNGAATPFCGGCHNSSPAAQAQLGMSPANATPNGAVTLTITMSNNAASGGFYITSDPPGTFITRAGEGTKLFAGGATHSTPKQGQGGVVTFKIDYQAPNNVPGVSFMLGVVAGNNDDTRNGDRSAEIHGSIAVGCDNGAIYYRDYDGDGFGRPGPENEIRACSKPPGYADNDQDCNDNNEMVFPGNQEICNRSDDNCDGQIDEGLPVHVLYEDADGDGYGRLGSQMMMGCGPRPGWGIGNGDCDDNNKDIHPGAMEMCNLRDDDCNGLIDDGARYQCGEGICRRSAPGCNPVLCTPGRPRKETCNYIDDDCNGVIDDGDDLCDEGQICRFGQCTDDDGSGSGGMSMMPQGGRAGSDDEDDRRDDRNDQRSRGGCAIGGPGSAVPPLPLWPIAVVVGWAVGRCRAGRRQAGLGQRDDTLP